MISLPSAVFPSLAPDDERMPSALVRGLQATLLLLLAVLGAWANCLVLLVFYRRPALRSPSNRFVLSLVLSNLLSSIVVAPVLMVHVLNRDVWWLSPLASGLTTLAVTASIFSILAIAVDRYNAVLSPLHYAMTITRQRSRGMISAAWGVAAFLATPPLLGILVRPPAAPPHSYYDINCSKVPGGDEFRLIYAVTLVGIGFSLPLFVLSWIYARMYNAAHLNSKRTRRHSISTNPGELVSSQPASRGGSLDLPMPPTGNGTPENFRRIVKNPPISGMPKRRYSNASFSTLLFREEGRAVKTAAMVIASYLFCWTIYFATIMADTWGSAKHLNGTEHANMNVSSSAIVNHTSVHVSTIPELCRFFALFFALSSGCITPFIYVFRNEAARNEAVKIVTWWKNKERKYENKMSRCGRDFETYNSNGKPPIVGIGSAPAGFGLPTQDNFSLRRQSLSLCDSISVQSFQIPTATTECRHCTDPLPGVPTADFVATYEVIESPNDDEEELTKRTTGNDDDSTVQKPATRIRRESVTFRLAFLPQRRCQTCIRQNSDSSSGSGHPLLRDGDSFDSRTPPVPANCNSTSSMMKMTVSQRRHQFLVGRQGSSGEELTGGSGSESGTPRHLPFRRPLAIAPSEEMENSRQVFVNHNNNESVRKSGAVILELEEQSSTGTRTMPRSAALLQFQETSLEGDSSLSASQDQGGEICEGGDPVPRQDSTHSDTTIRQDSNYSDVTVDSGVVADMGAAFNRSHSSSSSLSTTSMGTAPHSKRHRHKLQRLAAVEDEEACDIATIHEAVETPSVKSRLKSSFKSRFYRPAFRLPKCDF
ncbi:uncharacterized protein [Anabrus simplex]|uniref:uncharacterized protein n=1 Tax=Anabrus simplex TaxID=316456 RepID=UPI0034DDA09D